MAVATAGFGGPAPPQSAYPSAPGGGASPRYDPLMQGGGA